MADQGLWVPRSARIQRFSVALASAVLLFGTHPAFATLFDVSVGIEPAQPSTYQPFTVRIGGLSTDSCVPTDAYFFEDFTYLWFIRPTTDCAAVVTPWSLPLTFTNVPSGYYTFIFFDDADIVESFDFEVAERIGTVSHGVEPRRAVCKNRTTGQRVVVPGASTTINCEAEGLLASPGDRVVIRVRGAVP